MFKHLILTKQKEENMNKISKLFLGILSSALLISPTFAGEMTVTGGATATYTTNGDDPSSGKTIGISNELDFTASGELDNGYTWTYQVQLDGATTANDDTKLVIGTDYGTIGLFNTEGGLSQELAHGVGAMGVGFDYISPSTFQAGYDVSSYSNIQYHLPAGILPFGAGVKVGYAPNMAATGQLSAKDSAAPADAGAGGSLEMINVTLAPIDGLSIGADAARTADQTGGTGLAEGEKGVSANIGAKYTMGQFTVGYTEGGYQPAIAAKTGGETVYYENQFLGVQFDVNDALSVSFNRDESQKNQRIAVAGAATAGTKTVTTMEQDSIQVAYTMGGATLGLTQVEVDNADYTVGKKETQNVISLGISF
jgi:hypothetical protein